MQFRISPFSCSLRIGFFGVLPGFESCRHRTCCLRRRLGAERGRGGQGCRCCVAVVPFFVFFLSSILAAVAFFVFGGCLVSFGLESCCHEIRGARGRFGVGQDRDSRGFCYGLFPLMPLQFCNFFHLGNFTRAMLVDGCRRDMAGSLPRGMPMVVDKSMQVRVREPDGDT